MHKLGKTKQNKTKQNKTKQNKTKQNKTKQNKTKQNKTKQNKTLCLYKALTCLETVWFVFTAILVPHFTVKFLQNFV